MVAVSCPAELLLLGCLFFCVTAYPTKGKTDPLPAASKIYRVKTVHTFTQSPFSSSGKGDDGYPDVTRYDSLGVTSAPATDSSWSVRRDDVRSTNNGGRAFQPTQSPAPPPAIKTATTSFGDRMCTTAKGGCSGNSAVKTFQSASSPRPAEYPQSITQSVHTFQVGIGKQQEEGVVSSADQGVSGQDLTGTTAQNDFATFHDDYSHGIKTDVGSSTTQGQRHDATLTLQQDQRTKSGSFDFSAGQNRHDATAQVDHGGLQPGSQGFNSDTLGGSFDSSDGQNRQDVTEQVDHGGLQPGSQGFTSDAFGGSFDVSDGQNRQDVTEQVDHGGLQPGSQGFATFGGSSDGRHHVKGEAGGSHSDDGQYYRSGEPIDWLRYNIPGNPGQDYPIFYEAPETTFSCEQQPFSAGIYGDMDASCQVFHVCKDNGEKASFLCPNGTVFNQQFFVCDWWYNFRCSDTPSFYNMNADLYWDWDSFTPSQMLDFPGGHANFKGTPHRGGGSMRPSTVFEEEAGSRGNSGKNTIAVDNSAAFDQNQHANREQKPDEHTFSADRTNTGQNTQQTHHQDVPLPDFGGVVEGLQPAIPAFVDGNVDQSRDSGSSHFGAGNNFKNTQQTHQDVSPDYFGGVVEGLQPAFVDRNVDQSRGSGSGGDQQNGNSFIPDAGAKKQTLSDAGVWHPDQKPIEHEAKGFQSQNQDQQKSFQEQKTVMRNTFLGVAQEQSPLPFDSQERVSGSSYETQGTSSSFDGQVAQFDISEEAVPDVGLTDTFSQQGHSAGSFDETSGKTFNPSQNDNVQGTLIPSRNQDPIESGNVHQIDQDIQQELISTSFFGTEPNVFGSVNEDFNQQIRNTDFQSQGSLFDNNQQQSIFKDSDVSDTSFSVNDQNRVSSPEIQQEPIPEPFESKRGSDSQSGNQQQFQSNDRNAVTMTTPIAEEFSNIFGNAGGVSSGNSEGQQEYPVQTAVDSSDGSQGVNGPSAVIQNEDTKTFTSQEHTSFSDSYGNADVNADANRGLQQEPINVFNREAPQGGYDNLNSGSGFVSSPWQMSSFQPTTFDNQAISQTHNVRGNNQVQQEHISVPFGENSPNLFDNNMYDNVQEVNRPGDRNIQHQDRQIFQTNQQIPSVDDGTRPKDFNQQENIIFPSDNFQNPFPQGNLKGRDDGAFVVTPDQQTFSSGHQGNFPSNNQQDRGPINIEQTSPTGNDGNRNGGQSFGPGADQHQGDFRPPDRNNINQQNSQILRDVQQEHVPVFFDGNRHQVDLPAGISFDQGGRVLLLQPPAQNDFRQQGGGPFDRANAQNAHEAFQTRLNNFQPTDIHTMNRGALQNFKGQGQRHFSFRPYGQNDPSTVSFPQSAPFVQNQQSHSDDHRGPSNNQNFFTNQNGDQLRQMMISGPFSERQPGKDQYNNNNRDLARGDHNDQSVNFRNEFPRESRQHDLPPSVSANSASGQGPQGVVVISPDDVVSYNQPESPSSMSHNGWRPVIKS